MEQEEPSVSLDAAGRAGGGRRRSAGDAKVKGNSNQSGEANLFFFFQDNLTSALLNENGPNLNLSRRGLAR